MKLSIIMAVYNEGSLVGDTLERVWNERLQGVQKEIVIVESNSKDDSRAVCQAFTERTNRVTPGSTKLILQDAAQGKGNAIREGLRVATGDIILIQDADSEYSTKDYQALINPILQGKATFVLGSRHMSAGSWQIRKFEKSPAKAALLNIGGTFFHALFNLVYGTKLTDPTTMYKVFRRSCVQGVLFEANRFDFDYELTGKLIRLGNIPLEIPVSYTSRGFEEGKKIRIFKDPITWVRAIIRYRFAPLRSKSLAREAANSDVVIRNARSEPRCVNGD